MDIIKVETGSIDDDFLHDRVTLKVFISFDQFLPMKLYKDGRITSFSVSYDPYEYKEKEISKEDRKKVVEWIGLN